MLSSMYTTTHWCTALMIQGKSRHNKRIFDNQDHRMMDLFRCMTNLQSRGKIITPPPKRAEETIYHEAYNHHLQLLTSRMRIIDNVASNIKLETIDSGLLITMKHEATPLPEAIDLDKVLRKLKLSVKHLISKDQKLADLMVAMKVTTVPIRCKVHMYNACTF